MRKRVWLAFVLAAALAWGASMKAPAQEIGAGRCGTGDLQVAMEREAVRKAAEEAAARAARESGTVVEPAWRKKGLVLRYGFGQGGEWGPGTVVKDLSGGGHDGKVEGDGLEVVRGIGKRGKAVRFDGKGDYIRVPRNEAFESEEITFAVWVKLREGAATSGEEGIGAVVFKRNTSFHDNEDYCLEIHPGRLLRTDLSSLRGGHAKVTTRDALAPELWHHVAVTVGGGVARIYVDGVLAVEKSHPHPFDHNQMTDLFVGARDHAEGAMSRFGAFDLYELTIWNEVLCAERVAALYRERAGHFGVAKPEMGKGKRGLALYYAFDKGGEWGPGAIVKDLSGNGHDGTVEGNGLEVVRGMGKRGQAVRFDGECDYIRVPREDALESKEMSVAAWMRIREEDSEGDSGTIVYKRNTSFHENEGFCLEIIPDFRLKATVANQASRGQCQVFSSAAMAKDVWHHVAMTYASGRACLYLDGVLAGSGSVPEALDFNPSADWLIGVRDHAEYPLSRFGVFELADFKMWNESLDAERIAKLYEEKAGELGIGRPEDNKPPMGGGHSTALVSKDKPPRCGGRVFPQWTPDEGTKMTSGAEWLAELRALVAQGQRDRAASPEFLGALEGLIEKYKGATGRNVEQPSSKLPLKLEFQGPGMPTGWSAVRPEVWRFGDGEARQVESKANTRYVLFYEPGMEWKDYEVTFRFESDKWLQPPANSAAAVYFRYKSVEEAYSIAFDGFGQIWLSSQEKGVKGGRVLALVPMARETILDGKPWTIKAKGKEIELWHEGKRVVYVTDTAHESGTVGIESIHIPMKFGGLEVR